MAADFVIDPHHCCYSLRWFFPGKIPPLLFDNLHRYIPFFWESFHDQVCSHQFHKFFWYHILRVIMGCLILKTLWGYLNCIMCSIDSVKSSFASTPSILSSIHNNPNFNLPVNCISSLCHDILILYKVAFDWKEFSHSPIEASTGFKQYSGP